MRRPWSAALGLLLVGCAGRLPPAAAQEEGVERTRLRAPEFPADAEWLNVAEPLRLADLRGKVVLLDFWTYCCINCMHILPELARLEAKYADSLVVIGVHSAKFATEQETDNIRQAIRRYEIGHPVLNDAGFRVWQSYAVHAWPTLVLIDAEGYYLGSHSGEITFEMFDPAIGRAVAEADAAGTLRRGPLELRLERDLAPRTVLSYPGKILADPAGGRLFIADSTHHRYVVCDLDGTITETIGSGVAGFADGSFATAQFRKPQGMALDGDRLYLADTENHAVRVADLAARTVTTLAGNGRKPRRLNLPGAGAEVSLHSPWDLLLHDGLLYVAMAGPHQIWTLDPATGEATPYAGSAREDIVDAPRQQAALAQPSGLTSDGERLYFADSETSSVRSVGFGGPEQRVVTHLGAGLFEFGDVDGPAAGARLQHPLGVAWHGGSLYIADTYNNKLKRLDLAAGRVTTFAGTGAAGAEDGRQATFDEPGGLSIAGDTLYVADTNNHAIRVIDLDGGSVRTLLLREPQRAMPPALAGYPRRRLEHPPVTVAPGAGELRLTLRPPAGWKLNPGAPLTVTVAADGPAVVAEQPTLTATEPTFPLALPLRLTAGAATVTVAIEAFTCSEGENGACVFNAVDLVVPVRVAAGGAAALELEAAL